MRRKAVWIVVALLLIAIVSLAFGLNTDSLDQMLGAETPAGEHTLASGAFAADADTDGLCVHDVEHSIMWQAYLAEQLRQPGSAKPVVRFALTLTRNPGESPTVSATLIVIDAAGKAIHSDAREVGVHRPKVKYRNLTIMTLNPGEGDWRDAEKFITSTMVNIAAARVMSTPPQNGAPYIPALLDAFRREIANAQHLYNADGQPFTKYSEVHAEIATALEQIAKNAPGGAGVMALAGALNDPETAVRINVAEILEKLKAAAAPAAPALTARLKDAEAGVRTAAAAALRAIGPQARIAIPDLVHALRDSEGVLSMAAAALRQIAPEHTPTPPQTLALYVSVLPELIDDLKYNEPRVRRIAAFELGYMGAAAKSAAPALAELLGDKQEYLNREAAAKALQNLGPDAAPAVPALIDGLKDAGGVVAFEAARALGAIGAPAKAAVPALAEALKSERIGLRPDAADALEKIGPDAGSAAPELIAALSDANSSLRIAAAKALAAVEPDPKIAFPALMERLDDEAAAKYVIEALGKLKSSISPAIPRLMGALKSSSAEVRLAAIGVLSKIEPRPQEISAALTAMMKDREDAVRTAAAKALSGAAQTSGDAGNIPALIDALIHGDQTVQAAAATALKKIGDAAAPALVEQLGQDFNARRAVGPLLAELGPAGKEAAAKAMRDLYQKADGNTRRAIVGMLKDFGPTGAVGIPVLIESFKESDTAMNATAREALKNLGAAATSALTEALKHTDARVRQNAANLLAELGGQAAASVPGLIEALKDHKTAYNAVIALGKIGADAKPAVPAMLHAVLRIDDVDDAAQSIAKIGVGAVPALIDGLKDSASRTRWMAAKALGYLGAAARDAVSDLSAAQNDKDSSVKKAASEALAKIKAGQ